MSARILIIGDTPDTVQMLTSWLESDGFSTIVLEKTADLLMSALMHRPALILVDVDMSVKDGIRACRELLAEPETRSIPVMLLTGCDPMISRMQTLLAGAVDYVMKPINLHRLSTRIRDVITHEEVAHAKGDTARSLEELAYAALSMLPCELAWLFELSLDARALESRAVASSLGDRSIEQLATQIGIDTDTMQVPLLEDDNPLVRVAVSRHTLLGMSVEQFKMKLGTQPLTRGFDALGLRYLSLVPLAVGQRILGILLVGNTERPNLETVVFAQAIAIISAHAAMLLDYSGVVDDLIKQEERTVEEHTFLSTVLDTMGDGLVVIDTNGRIEFVNSRLLRMTQYTQEELRGERIDVLFYPDDRQALVYGLLHERGSTIKFDQRLFTRSQSVMPVLLTRSALVSSDGSSSSGRQVLVLSDLTVQKKREEALERYSQQLQALNEAAEAISSSLSPQEVIRRILNAVVDMVNAAGASILLPSQENPDELVFLAAVGPRSEHIQGMRVPIEQGIAGWVVREARSQLVNDTSTDVRFYRDVDAASGLKTQSIIAVPLVISDQVVGVLEAVNKQSGTFDRVDLDLMESIAGTAAVAIENSRLFEQTRRRLNDLSTLLDASAAVSSTLDFGSVLELIARRLLDTLRVKRCQITSWNRSTNVLDPLAEVVDAYWLPGTGPECDLSQYPVRRTALAAGQAAAISRSEPELHRVEAYELVALGQQAVMALPLRVGGAITGLALVYTTMADSPLFTEDSDHLSRITQGWSQRLEQEQNPRWTARRNLTDLSNLLQAVPGIKWVAIEEWFPERNLTRRLCETGFGLWTEQQGHQQNLDDYATMKWVIAAAQPRVIERSGLADDLKEQSYLAQVGGEVCLIAPLMIRGHPGGLVRLIDSDARRVFDAEQISLCQGIANVVGNAMENAYLYHSLERRADALEAAYADLKYADQLKEDLLQNLSHEIQTPLMHVLGYIELMYSEAFGPLNTEQREKLAFVMERAQDLSQLAKNIITVQSLQSTRLNIRPTELEEIIPHTVNLWEAEAAKRSITIETDMPDDLPRVMADPPRLAEALSHLLNNAIKFSPQNTQVEVIVTRQEAVVQVSVRDHGAGIEPEYHEHIFKRFYQVDGGATRKFGGTGLGLAIVQEIIAQHGGRVWVESTPGKGSTFNFVVPKAGTVNASDFGIQTGRLVEDHLDADG